jgi:hypothetical protein
MGGTQLEVPMTRLLIEATSRRKLTQEHIAAETGFCMSTVQPYKRASADALPTMRAAIQALDQSVLQAETGCRDWQADSRPEPPLATDALTLMVHKSAPLNDLPWSSGSVDDARDIEAERRRVDRVDIWSPRPANVQSLHDNQNEVGGLR